MGIITWRSLTADPSHAQASNILGAAQNSFGSAFDALQRVLSQHEGFQAQQAQQAQEAVKQSYLDQLASAKTPEELAALQASGGLAEIRARLNPTNQAAVRGAEDARLTGIRQAWTAGQEFSDKQDAVAQQPVEQAIKTLYNAGSFDAARAATQGMLKLRNRGDIMGLIQAAEVAATGRKNQADRTKLELEALGRNAETQKLTTADAAETRKLQSEVFAATQARLLERDRVKEVYGKLAKGLGKPLGSDGFPDFSQFNKAELQLFDEAANSRNMPRSSVGGDTAAGANLLTQLAKSGKYSPHILQANADGIRRAFNSSTPAPVGDDAANLAMATAKENVRVDALDAANSWHKPGAENMSGAYAELIKEAPIISNNRDGFLVDKTDRADNVQGLLLDLATKGIRVHARTLKDGTKIKEQWITPAPNVVRGLLQSAPAGWLVDNSLANNTKDALEKYYNSPEGFDALAKGAESQAYRQAQKVKEEFRTILSGQPVKK